MWPWISPVPLACRCRQCRRTENPLRQRVGQRADLLTQLRRDLLALRAQFVGGLRRNTLRLLPGPAAHLVEHRLALGAALLADGRRLGAGAGEFLGVGGLGLAEFARRLMVVCRGLLHQLLALAQHLADRGYHELPDHEEHDQEDQQHRRKRSRWG